MFDLDIYSTGLFAALALGLIAWLVHIPLENAGVADLWSPFFVLMAAVYILAAPVVADRSYLVFFRRPSGVRV